jgi:hypothetical protein
MANVFDLGPVRPTEQRYIWTVPTNIVNANDYALVFRWENKPESTFRYSAPLTILGGTNERDNFITPQTTTPQVASPKSKTTTSASPTATPTASSLPTAVVLNAKSGSDVLKSSVLGCGVLALIGMLFL